jgi:hypothetical protein
MSQKSTRYKTLLGALVLSFALAGCQLTFLAGPDYDGYYYYDYYPGAGVYYDTHYHVYYYRDRGRWIRSKRLPRHYNLRKSRRHHLRMKQSRPYKHHSNWRRYRHDGGRRRR